MEVEKMSSAKLKKPSDEVGDGDNLMEEAENSNKITTEGEKVFNIKSMPL